MTHPDGPGDPGRGGLRPTGSESFGPSPDGPPAAGPPAGGGWPGPHPGGPPPGTAHPAPYGSTPYGPTPYGSGPYGPGPHGAGPPGAPYPPGPPPMVCVRHPDRPTGLTCTRCGRPACPDCLRDAAVGAQCVDCVQQGRSGTRRGRTVAGAEPGRRPLVVAVLIALNVAVFVWTVVQARSIQDNADSALFDAWALQPGRVQAGEWWRVLTSGFLHIGPIHLLFNMMALWVLGRDMELVLGRGRFLAVYLVSLLGGAAAVMLFYAPNQSVAGASGAVFGLMGGLAVVLKRLRVPAGQVIGLIAMNVVISVLIPGISLIGHLGGLVVGAAATAALVYTPSGPNQRTVQVAALGGLTLLVLAVITVTAL